MAAPDLGKMIGPLPLGAWLAVVGGGLGLALYTRRQNVSEAPTDPDLMPEDTGTTPGVGTGGSGQWVPVGPSGNPPTDTPPQTNEEYARRAITMMIGRGYPPTTVASGINKWINETGTLSASEFSIVSETLRIMGAPPQGVSGPTQTPPVVNPPKPPAPKPKPVPSGYYVHTIVRGETMSRVATIYNTRPHSIWRANMLGARRADGSYGFLMYEGSVSNKAFIGRKLIIPKAIVGVK